LILRRLHSEQERALPFGGSVWDEFALLEGVGLMLSDCCCRCCCCSCGGILPALDPLPMAGGPILWYADPSVDDDMMVGLE